MAAFMHGLPAALARLEPHLPPLPPSSPSTAAAQQQRGPAGVQLNCHGAAPSAEARLGVLPLQATFVYATVLGRKLRVSSRIMNMLYSQT